MQININDFIKKTKQKAQKGSANPLLREPGKIALFSPAIFFLLLAAGVIFAPKFLFTIFAGILIFIAIGFGLLAWKIMTLKSKFENLRKGFKAKVFVNGIGKSGFSNFDGSSKGIDELFSELAGDDMSNLSDVKFDDDLNEANLSDFLDSEDLSSSDSIKKIKSKDGKLIEVIDRKKFIFH